MTPAPPSGYCCGCWVRGLGFENRWLEKGHQLEGKGNKIKGDEGMGLRDPSGGQADHMEGRRRAGLSCGEWTAEPGEDFGFAEAAGDGQGQKEGQGRETGDSVRSKA